MSLVEKMCTYLNSAKSTTWWQMQCIAVHPLADGGLGLFREGSREFRAVFSQMLGTIVEDRPESVMNFLRFLRGREKTLALCAAKDVVARDLKQGAYMAAEALANVAGRVERSIMAELLHRSLHLERQGNLTRYIATSTRLSDLLDKACKVLFERAATSSPLERFGVTPPQMPSWRARTWVEVAVRLEYPDEAEFQRHLPQLNAFHLRVAGRMEAHLKLRGENVLRTPWLALSLIHI